jgi:hypothetical protein
MKKRLLLISLFALGTFLGYSQEESEKENLSKILDTVPMRFYGLPEQPNMSFLAKMPEKNSLISKNNYFAMRFNKKDKDTLFKTFTDKNYSKMAPFEKIKQKILGSRLESYLEYACSHGGELPNARKMVDEKEENLEAIGIVISKINKKNKKYFEGNLEHFNFYMGQEMLFLEYKNGKGERKQFPFLFVGLKEPQNLIEELESIRKD